LRLFQIQPRGMYHETIVIWSTFMQIYFEQEGRLENASLAGILKSFSDRSETGMLTFEQGSIKKSIFLDSGNFIFATSNRENDRLGIFLFRNGKLSLDAYERSSALLTPNRRHGEILVELGIISRQSLNWAVKEQVKEIIMSLFLWDHGSYSFISMDSLMKESITLKTKTLDLILEGCRRVNNWSLIRSEIGSLGTFFRFCKEREFLLKELYLKPKEKEVLALLKENRSVRDICVSLDFNDFVICRILMGLQSVGIIQKVASPVGTA